MSTWEGRQLPYENHINLMRCVGQESTGTTKGVVDMMGKQILQSHHKRTAPAFSTKPKRSKSVDWQGYINEPYLM